MRSAHGESASTLTEAVTAGAEVFPVAVLAVHLRLVHGHGGGVQRLVAAVAVEAAFVPWRVDTNGSLGVVDGLAAAWTLGPRAAAAAAPRPHRRLLGPVVHLALLVAESLALVHAQRAGAAAEAVALGAELAAVALLAEQRQLVVGHRRGVQHLAAHAALEAELVVLGAGRHALLGGVDGLAAHGALGRLGGLERHGAGRGLTDAPTGTCVRRKE